ncbi:hypothetical protein B0H21DRAFT_673146, partial [Amylocystis lapponica]
LHNFPVAPTADTLSFFVVWTSSFIDPRSVNSYLTGITSELEPHFPDIRHARNSALVRRTVKGCINLRSAPIRRKRALILDDLRLVWAALSSSPDLDDILFLSQFCTGFFALMRLGELVWPDSAALRDSRKLTQRRSVSLTADSFAFVVPSTKTDRFFEGSTVLVKRREHAVDPLAAFARYVAARDRRFGLRHELWLRADGSVPTRGWFVRRLRAFFPRDISGHSMRSGGATALAEAGTAPALIQ